MPPGQTELKDFLPETSCVPCIVLWPLSDGSGTNVSYLNSVQDLPAESAPPQRPSMRAAGHACGPCMRPFHSTLSPQRSTPCWLTGLQSIRAHCHLSTQACPVPPIPTQDSSIHPRSVPSHTPHQGPRSFHHLISQKGNPQRETVK